MEISLWIALGMIAGSLASFLAPSSYIAPPLYYRPTHDESIAELAAPVSRRDSMLKPILLGIGGAVLGGSLSMTLELESLLGIGLLLDFDATSVLSAVGGALVALIAYLLVALSVVPSRQIE